MAIRFWIIVQQAWVLQVLVFCLFFGFKCARDSYWIYIKISKFFLEKKKSISYVIHGTLAILEREWCSSNVIFVKCLHKILWLLTIWCLLQIMHQCRNRKLLQIKIFLPCLCFWLTLSASYCRCKFFFLMNMVCILLIIIIIII